jgi:signal recognition particle GTPase
MHARRERMDKSLAEQIHDVIESLLVAEYKAQRMLRTAKEKRISFGLTYNHTDDDINQLIARLRHMQSLAERRESGG